MVQSRICSYFEFHCKHTAPTPTTFLHLPENLRDRIYRDAGIITGTSIRILGTHLPSDLKKETYHPFRPITAASFCLRASHGAPIFSFTSSLDARLPATISYFNLSISSHSISNDVARFLCSHNEMLVCCEDHTGLLALLDLEPDLMKAFRRLTIHVNICSYHTPKCRKYADCCHQEPNDFSHGTHRLSSTSKTFRTFILLWRNVVSRLALLADLSNLKLSIMCDVGYVDTARLILNPLREVAVAPFAIRLGRTRNATLEDIAKQSVLSRTSTQPFRFLDLPPELRQAVLSFTDLVAPQGKVYCPGGAKFQIVPRWVTRYNCPSREFCAFDYAAYPHCNCWEPPTSIFLVSKGVLADVRATFFSSNRFIVSPAAGSMEKPFAASTFLKKKVPRDALSQLRSLEFVFDAALYDFSEFDEHIYRDWVHTIEYVAPHLKKLALHLVLGHGPLRVVNPLLPEHFPGWQNELFGIHKQIVQPLWKLKCLNKFSAEAGSPYDRAPIDGQQLRDHESLLETLVMEGKHDHIEPANRS